MTFGGDDSNAALAADAPANDPRYHDVADLFVRVSDDRARVVFLQKDRGYQLKILRHFECSIGLGRSVAGKRGAS